MNCTLGTNGRGRLTKRALGVKGRRGRLRLRREDCVKRDLSGMGEGNGEREIWEWKRVVEKTETGSAMENKKKPLTSIGGIINSPRFT